MKCVPIGANITFSTSAPGDGAPCDFPVSHGSGQGRAGQPHRRRKPDCRRPNAEPVEGAQDTGTTAEGLAFVKKMAMLSVPGLSFRDSIRNFAGVRANTNLDDFQIRWLEPGFLDVAGIKSPGLSSAPAIGEYVAELLMRDGVKLLFKKEFQEELPERVLFKELSPGRKSRSGSEKSPLWTHHLPL